MGDAAPVMRKIYSVARFCAGRSFDNGPLRAGTLVHQDATNAAVSLLEQRGHGRAAVDEDSRDKVFQTTRPFRLKTFAPIVLFVFRRPQHTLRALESLARNAELAHSELHVYCEGPRN